MRSSERKFALIGFMGSGKSCIGKILASRLGLPFADLDHEIERARGSSISGIFQHEGEAGFRLLEEKALSDLSGRRGGLVLSCGGGIVMSPANRALLSRAFTTVWVDVPLPELLRRLEGERKKRPLLDSDDYAEKAASLMEARRPLYGESSSLIYRWTEGESTNDSASAIMELISG